MEMNMTEKNSRREFLKSSGMFTAGAVVAATFPTPLMVHAAGSDQLKVAVIGCGGRGTGAALDCYKAGGNVKFVAVADAFEDAAKRAAAEITKQCGEKADIPPERIFAGLDAYQKAIDSGVDMVIMAIGQGPNPLLTSTTPDLALTKWGNIIADLETCKTNKKGVFAGGDIVTGAATVILAMGAGKKAAKAIDDYLRDGTW